jgi:Delta7-sterol 5-desaturase
VFDKMSSGGHLDLWLALCVAIGFFKARRIQPGRFKWSIFRHEAMFTVINLSVTAFTLGPITKFLTSEGYITFKSETPAWWVMGLEYALYFFLFDTWFYWWHRLMHKEPFYRLFHKVHHKSTAPNLLTTVSENPAESLMNGIFLPLFLCVLSVHQETMFFITPTSIIMGFYVHSGHEFLPRWWNKSWVTKWFITATFHDQHHKYFNYNFAAYTPLWDYLCGTARKNYERDFAAARAKRPAVDADQTEGFPA